MLLFQRPTTFFGEPLRDGALRIAEFCAIKSIGLLILISICIMSGGIKILGVFVVIPIFLLLVTVGKIIVNVLLYKAVLNGDAFVVTVWLWVYAVQTVVLMTIAFGGAIAFIVLLPEVSHLALFAYVLVFMYCAVIKYFCQVVYSHRREMYQPVSMTLTPV